MDRQSDGKLEYGRAKKIDFEVLDSLNDTEWFEVFEDRFWYLFGRAVWFGLEVVLYIVIANTFKERIIRSILTIWAWFGVFICATLGFIVQLALLPYTVLFDRHRIRSGRIFRLSAVAATKLNPLWRFSVAGQPPVDIGAAVVVSNHCSHADSFLISHLPFEMKWFGKKSLFNIPIVGWSMRLSGDIPVRRGDKASVKESMKQCLNYLANGVPIMMFPEGTRSRDGRLQPFKEGAFRLALLDAQVPILPIAVAGTHTALKKNDWRFDHAQARVLVGTKIETQGRDLDSIRAEAYEAVARLHDELTQLSKSTG